MSRITGSSRPATPADVRQEADRIEQIVRSARPSRGQIETVIDSGSPGAVAIELRSRGFTVDQLGGSSVRVSKSARRLFHG